MNATTRIQTRGDRFGRTEILVNGSHVGYVFKIGNDWLATYRAGVTALKPESYHRTRRQAIASFR